MPLLMVQIQTILSQPTKLQQILLQILILPLILQLIQLPTQTALLTLPLLPLDSMALASLASRTTIATVQQIKLAE